MGFNGADGVSDMKAKLCETASGFNGARGARDIERKNDEGRTSKPGGSEFQLKRSVEHRVAALPQWHAYFFFDSSVIGSSISSA